MCRLHASQQADVMWVRIQTQMLYIIWNSSVIPPRSTWQVNKKKRYYHVALKFTNFGIYKSDSSARTRDGHCSERTTPHQLSLVGQTFEIALIHKCVHWWIYMSVHINSFQLLTNPVVNRKASKLVYIESRSPHGMNGYINFVDLINY